MANTTCIIIASLSSSEVAELDEVRQVYGAAAP
jgi:hypothetical protein